ncbi:hypothetical protein ACVWXU_000716 [Streptomyces sp. TE33382]
MTLRLPLMPVRDGIARTASEDPDSGWGGCAPGPRYAPSGRR